ncbi:hypothetical protein [Rhizobium sp.]
MTPSFALLILSAAVCAWIALRSMRDQREAMAERSGLLAEAGEVLSGATTVIGPDHYPVVTGRIDDGRQIKVELIADTLVTRRLPQLWLRVTLYDAAPDRPTIGMLARPTGSEYYSLVHDMPEWMEPPVSTAPILMRGDGTATPEQAARVARHFGGLFADAAVKEAVISPRGVRIVRQAAQGERGAHLLLRQSRFAIATVPAADIAGAVAMAMALATAHEAARPAAHGLRVIEAA